jgi:hypothetical protein
MRWRFDLHLMNWKAADRGRRRLVSWLGASVGNIGAFVALWRQVVHERSLIIDMTPYGRADIGVTKCDIRKELECPAWRVALQRLRWQRTCGSTNGCH